MDLDPGQRALRPYVSSGLGLSVLFVEDEEDLRAAIVTLLEAEGYRVTEAASAEAGLARLTEQRFDLVICDYMLSGNTGVWMLQEAKRLGLMSGVPAIIVTAYPSDISLEGVDILRKPLDIDDFLDNVTRVLQPARRWHIEEHRSTLSSGGALGEAPADRRLIELVLYISGSSTSSLKAVRNLHRLLDLHEREQVSFEICDLSRGWSQQVDEDRVVFTPTLVKRFPAPRTWLIGNLEDTQLVEDLLLDAGVDRKR